MKKTFLKSFFKNIYHSLSRLLSIICIVILGVGFLVGLLTCAPNIENSIDHYYDQYNVSDIDMMTTFGIYDEHKEFFDSIDSIENYKFESRNDSYVTYNGDALVSKVIDYDFDSEINQVEITEGRIPESSNEICVHVTNGFLEDIPLDSVITIDSVDYKVVGKILDPNFFDRARTSSTLGNGYINVITYRNQDFVDIDYYTDVFITVKGARELSSFSNAYQDLIQNTIDQLEDNESTISSIIFTKLRDDIYSQVYEETYNQIKTQISETFPNLSEETILGMVDSMITSENVVSQMNEATNKAYEENVDESSFTLINLDREYYQAFRSISENVNKINVISLIFPVFFFLVAALVVLTTMTRMVEEERLQIGTLKSLGYSRGKIMANYLGYGLISSLIGGILGICAGVYFLPALIYSIFEANYILPDFVMTFSYPAILISFFVMMGIILLTTLLTVWKTLKEKPADLMVKRAPKPGKKILLERINIIWKHLKFQNKSALRNVFRYKKHMIMTIVGVAGCTALLITGFGIKDSFDDMVYLQYNDVINYKLEINVKDPSQPIAVLDGYENTNIYSEAGYIHNKDSVQYDFTLIVFENMEEVESYYNVPEKTYDSNSIIISSQLNDELVSNEDGTYTLFDQTRRAYSFTYDTVFTSYINNYILMGKDAYNSILKTECTFNTVLVKINNFDQTLENYLSSQLLNDSNVNSFSYIEDDEETYNNMFSNIGMLVYFLIICSGALAIIVIYNLTNINIIERNKEIATLKVLGYNRREVSGYMYKETFILTTMGIFVGILVGFLLHQFIMFNVDSPGVLSFKGIKWQSYIYSILLSYLFLFIVDFLLYFKLEKIKMVESLKSVD